MFSKCMDFALIAVRVLLLSISVVYDVVQKYGNYSTVREDFTLPLISVIIAERFMTPFQYSDKRSINR